MSERCKTKGCGRYVYNIAVGYCPECLRPAQSTEAEKPASVSLKPKSVSLAVSKPKDVSHKVLASGTVNKPLIDTKPIKMRYPRGVCQKCGSDLAKGSGSYCREHERERLREWRKKQKGPNNGKVPEKTNSD